MGRSRFSAIAAESSDATPAIREPVDSTSGAVPWAALAIREPVSPTTSAVPWAALAARTCRESSCVASGAASRTPWESAGLAGVSARAGQVAGLVGVVATWGRVGAWGRVVAGWGRVVRGWGTEDGRCSVEVAAAGRRGGEGAARVTGRGGGKGVVG